MVIHALLTMIYDIASNDFQTVVSNVLLVVHALLATVIPIVNNDNCIVVSNEVFVVNNGFLTLFFVPG